jgi:hypothetical protein
LGEIFLGDGENVGSPQIYFAEEAAGAGLAAAVAAGVALEPLLEAALLEGEALSVFDSEDLGFAFP